MNHLADLVAPIVWSCTGLAALAFVAGIAGSRSALRRIGGLLLLLASLALLAGLAHPALLPAASAAVHPDGSTDDPRVLASLLLVAASLFALLPGWFSLKPTPMGSVSLALPGIVLAGLCGAVASFAGLRQPMALTAIALGALVAGTALVLALRARSAGHAPLALQAFATALLAIAGTLSLHGARVGVVNVAEGAAVDSLGQRMYFAGVESPASDVRRLKVVLYSSRDSVSLHPELRGAAGRNVASVADARLFSGPIVVPIALEERRARAHDVQWIDKSKPLQAGGASIQLVGFRFVKGDTIRLYADLDVTTATGKHRVSPGEYATNHGEIPFAAQVPGFGPIALARVDADHGRAGLVLPQLSEANVSRTAALDLRLRPALPVAWAGGVLALLAFVFGMASPSPAPRRR